MTEFKLEDQPKIDLGNPAWRTIEGWVQMNLKRLRKQRENPLADLRKLDVDLGGIVAMKALLGLPKLISEERRRKDDPIQGDEFNIPTPKGY